MVYDKYRVVVHNGKIINILYESLIRERLTASGRCRFESCLHTIHHNQPERSKREDSQKCEMRCSEHYGQRSEGSAIGFLA